LTKMGGQDGDGGVRALHVAAIVGKDSIAPDRSACVHSVGVKHDGLERRQPCFPPDLAVLVPEKLMRSAASAGRVGK